MPMIGTSTALNRSYTARRANGLIAGPDSPPVMFPNYGRSVLPVYRKPFVGIHRGNGVGARVLRGAPDRCDIGHVGSQLDHQQSRPGLPDAPMTAPVSSGSEPMEAHPECTLGQEMFNSRPTRTSTHRTSSSNARGTGGQSAYSLPEKPPMLTIKGKAKQGAGAVRSTNASIPAAGEPDRVEHPASCLEDARGGLPIRGSMVTVLDT